VKATIRGRETARWRNRKGELSQNVLAACNFNYEITYVISGWEGSAADARILENALSRPTGLKVPSGNSYTSCDIIKNTFNALIHYFILLFCR
jgi:hypothetical protein